MYRFFDWEPVYYVMVALLLVICSLLLVYKP